MNCDGYDSWEAYWETLHRHHQPGRSSIDQGSYLPSPDQIQERRDMLHALKDWGFNDAFIASVMQQDTPTFPTVADSVERYGPEATWERYKDFI